MTTDELKIYKCTITITDGEQIRESDFYVEASSFEEAVSSIETELDIEL